MYATQKKLAPGGAPKPGRFLQDFHVGNQDAHKCSQRNT